MKSTVDEQATPASPHAGDFGEVQRVVAGDMPAWEGFLAKSEQAIRPTIVGWCHRISSGKTCRHCAPTEKSDCEHYYKARCWIAERLRDHVLPEYHGLVSLGEFTAALITSEWWFRDFIAEAAPATPGAAAGEPDQRADLVQTWAILTDSRSAWNAFLQAFSGYIERTAILWCHRVVPGRVCRNCKPGLAHGCDAFGEAYLYLLKRIRLNALAAFGGRSSLRTFIYVCLRDHRWWKDFVEKETGKVKLPRILESAPEFFQRVYVRIAWGWDDERIAASLKRSPEEVSEARSSLEQRLREVGRDLPRRIETLSLERVRHTAGDEEVVTCDPEAGTFSPEIRAEAVRFWQRLSIQDRTILRLAVQSGRTAEEVAASLGLQTNQVYAVIYRVRREMPAWFRSPEKRRKDRVPVPSKDRCEEA